MKTKICVFVTCICLCVCLSFVITGCRSGSDDVEPGVQQEVVIDGKVLVKTDHFDLFLLERMTDEEKQTIADGIDSFSRRFEELLGVPPARGMFLV